MRIKRYIQEAFNELVFKVTWPSWKELQSSAIIVMVASLMVALIIFLMDFVFGARGTDEDTWRGVLGFIYEMIG